MLEVDGALGAWAVPVEVLPITETGVAPQRTVDSTTTKHGITVRLVGIALREEDAMVELAATWDPPIAAIHGIGAMMQRQGDDRLVLIDGQGRRYVKIVHETQQHAPAARRARPAKFPPSRRPRRLTLIVPSWWRVL